MSFISVLLAGSPNSGKSTLFNTLTGSRQKVANYPGVTVEKKSGFLKTPSGNKLEILDLPGIYSLNPTSIDEEIAFKHLTQNKNDVIVAVTDATNLERNLGFVLELIELNKPLIIALNMADLALAKGIKVDHKKLEKILGVPVLPTIALRKDGLTPLLEAIDKIQKPNKDMHDINKNDNNTVSAKSSAEERYAKVDEILKDCLYKPTNSELTTYKIDRVLLHPIFGGIIFALIIATMFQCIFSFAEFPMTLIEDSIAMIGEAFRSTLPDGFVQSFVVDGIIAGVGSVLVFLPQILLLFFFIFLMEATGYMARAAFIMDRLMSFIGLQGRSFVPLLSSFACAIPGIMSARTVHDPRERLTTILIAPLMTCSARLPVYVLLIGAFIPNHKYFGFIGLQGLAMTGLFVFGIFSAIVVAFILRKSALRGQRSSFIMELPTYKLPNFKQLFLNLYFRAKTFIKKAGGFILWVSIALWFLSTFPRPPADWQEPAINYSFAGRIGHAIEPVFRPLGFDWRISTGLIPGFAAREVMVSALATVFAVEEGLEEEQQMMTLSEKLRSTWPMATGLALLVWYIFAPQCLATFVVARKETGGWKWPIFMFAYMFALAYVGAWLTYRICLAF